MYTYIHKQVPLRACYIAVYSVRVGSRETCRLNDITKGFDGPAGQYFKLSACVSGHRDGPKSGEQVEIYRRRRISVGQHG